MKRAFAPSSAVFSSGGDSGNASRVATKTAAAAPLADPARFLGVGSVITAEEDADVDASSRLARLKALVARKRLYFSILAALETVEKPIPRKLARFSDVSFEVWSPESANAMVDSIEACEAVVNDVSDAEELTQRLERQLATLFQATKEDGGDIFGRGNAAASEAAESVIAAKTKACARGLRRRAELLIRDGLPYKDVDEAKRAVEEATARLAAACETTTGLGKKGIDKLPRPVAKTVERVGSGAKSARGLINTGVNKLREKPLSAASAAAAYTKGVWVRLNGGMDGGAVGTPDPRIESLPSCASLSELRDARALRLASEVRACDKALSEASIEREKVLNDTKGRDSLSRVRLAKSIRERDDRVRDLRRAFAVRTLQLEMERILMQLEEEASEPPSLETPDRADEVELLAAEFGAMDAGLRKLAWMVDTENLSSIEDDDLTALATDVPDLKSRLGLVDRDGLSSLSPRAIRERVSRTTSESADKAREAFEFMTRGVKMLGVDIATSARFFGRAVMGSTLRPREVQTIRRTTLDVFTFVPFIVILIIPLTPVGHVLIFSFIQRYFPALFPSQFSGRRQELMKKYEELSSQLKEAEKSKEIREEDEALARAVTAVESLMMGGATDAEVALAARAASANFESNDDGGKKRSNSFFKLKGLERMASGEDVVDVQAVAAKPSASIGAAAAAADDEGSASGKTKEDDEVETLRKTQESLRSTLSFADDDPAPESR